MMRMKRMNRTGGLALLLAFALIVAACGDDGGSEAADTTAAPTTTAAPSTTAGSTTSSTDAAPEGKPYGGEVIYGDDQEPPTLNTYLPGGSNSIVSKIGASYWTGVQDIDGFTLELIPEVVTELPTVANGGITINADGTETIRYTIRDEAQWADGTPVSGYDYEFTYQTIMNPDYPITRSVYEDIIPESVVAGDKTFEFTLAAPTLQAAPSAGWAVGWRRPLPAAVPSTCPRPIRRLPGPPWHRRAG